MTLSLKLQKNIKMANKIYYVKIVGEGISKEQHDESIFFSIS
jgi:hypothetical protein